LTGGGELADLTHVDKSAVAAPQPATSVEVEPVAFASATDAARQAAFAAGAACGAGARIGGGTGPGIAPGFLRRPQPPAFRSMISVRRTPRRPPSSSSS
jgi:hypothetical protein